MLGTVFGYFLPDMVPPDLLQIIIFITPIYIFLLITTARQKANRLAVALGGILCPVFYPLAGEWSIFLAGVVGGTLAIGYARLIAKWHLKRGIKLWMIMGFGIWLAVGLAAVGTFVWRLAGVLLASKIPAQSPVMDWVNTMAYSMVAGVLMLMLAIQPAFWPQAG